MSGFSVTPVEGLPELREGDDLAALIVERVELEEADVVVVAQKAISKVEGCVVALADVEPSDRARELAGDEADARSTVAASGGRSSPRPSRGAGRAASATSR